MFCFRSLAAALLLALADATASTYSQEKCFTALGSTPGGKVQTTTKARTITLPAFVKTVVSHTKTITPQPSTVTSTSIVTATSTTTLSQMTDTFSTTTTFFTTSTATSTNTATASETSTTTTTDAQSTTTIPASAGYTPIQTVLAGMGNVNSFSKHKRGAALQRLDARAAAQSSNGGSNQCTVKKSKGGQPTMSPAKYPAAVTCLELVEVVSTTTFTFTAPKTATITKPASTSTVPTTSTVTSVSTATLMDASTTSSFSTTSTLSTTSYTTTTSTTTFTSTVEVTPAAATQYAVCQPNNFIHYVNANPVEAISASNGFNFVNANDMYECCTMCINAGNNCGGSSFIPGVGLCFLFNTDGSCNGANSVGSFQTDPSQQGDDGFYVSNGNCGQANFAGAV